MTVAPPPNSSRPVPQVRTEARDVWGGLTGAPLWADAPTIDPQPTGWWCTCYKTSVGADHTACRRRPTECVALREMVQTVGSSSILRGSASPGACRHVPGAYPWLQLGRRESWAESAYSDLTSGAGVARTRRRATQAIGICAL